MDAARREGENAARGKGEVKAADSSNDMNSVLEGQLLKFTSILKGGFLPRWFILDPQTGTLTYYLSQEALKKKSARGVVSLLGAQVSPSEEDSQTFSVNAANGEIFKLKAQDAKERQLWVSRLRHTVESLAPLRSSKSATMVQRSQSHGRGDPGSPQRAASMSHGSSRAGRSHTDGAPLGQGAAGPRDAVPDRKAKSRESSPHAPSGKKRGWGKYQSPPSSTGVQPSLASDPGPLQPIFQACSLASQQEQELRSLLEQQKLELHRHGSLDVHSDPNILLLKATAQANLVALQRCLSMLVEYQQRLKASGLSLEATDLFDPDMASLHSTLTSQNSQTFGTGDPPPRKTSTTGSVHSPQLSEDLLSSSSSPGISPRESATSVLPSVGVTEPDSAPRVDSKSDEELLDADHLYSDDATELSRRPSLNSLVEKENRGSVLQLCSSLKLGMNLTTVTFPVSLLEGRSVLELFADLFGHPQLLLQVAEGRTPCQRMVSVVRQYICAFHNAFQHQPVRKPYNAQLGEVFLCQMEPHTRSVSVSSRQAESEDEEAVVMNFVAEQVSHHPPVSAFHLDCPKRGVSLTADISYKSKFLGMSAGTDIIGQGCLSVAAHKEDYTFTFPSMYCRSILTSPWLEFNGRVRITCPQTAYQATITFPPKPAYGEEFNKVVAEIRPKAGAATVCKISGRWDGVLTTTHDNGETEVMDITHLSHGRKIVQPMRAQSKMESRRLWRHVTSALKEGNNKLAQSHKQSLEDVQREEASVRLANGTDWAPKYFSQVDSRWEFQSSPHSTAV